MSAITSDSVIAVIGAGTMGAGIAQVAATAGHPVLLFDVQHGAAEKGIQACHKALGRLVERGKMSAEDCEALIGHMQPCDRIEDLAPAALVIEAIVERLDVKQTLFKQLETLCLPETILATNTSSLSVTAIGSALQRPENLVGMHFFHPAPIMKLVEVISGMATDPTVADCIYDTAKAWGKLPVHARSTPGFIVNRVARPYYAEALRVYQEGAADCATIDAVMRDCGGFRMGPFELMDLIGHDVNYAVTSSVYESYYFDKRFLPSLVQKELVDGGYLGRKSGRGFYQYGENATPPLAQSSEAEEPPQLVEAIGIEGVLKGLIDRSEQQDFPVELNKNIIDGVGWFDIDGVRLMLTDGRAATQMATEFDCEHLVLIDWAADYQKCQRVAISKADQCSQRAANRVIGWLQAIGLTVSQLDDVPGLVLMRTLAMLANEGSDAVHQGVCSAADVDQAMMAGVNYPMGPLAWAAEFGLNNVITVLSHLVKVYGEERYRVSPLLHRLNAAQRGFND